SNVVSIFGETTEPIFLMLLLLVHHALKSEFPLTGDLSQQSNGYNWSSAVKARHRYCECSEICRQQAMTPQPARPNPKAINAIPCGACA
ncbi:hypothetical protein, partial [Sphingobium sp.]|uniref:hypothetical protein n=1 Tax=Sphingobium sp. TaxID=1912891 RepID=UPI00257F7CCB